MVYNAENHFGELPDSVNWTSGHLVSGVRASAELARAVPSRYPQGFGFVDQASKIL